MKDRDRFQRVAGVDEAGRGCLAGPVVAAAVMLAPQCSLEGVMDSKKLSVSKREYLSTTIKEASIAWAVGQASVVEIDHMNILWASMLAMQRSVNALAVVPELVRVDGNRCPAVNMPVEAIVAGDASEQEIAAASIIAKVTRDDMMRELDIEHPGYGFAKHKGYPTTAHRQAILRCGVTPHHRRSFRPVAEALARGGESHHVR